MELVRDVGLRPEPPRPDGIPRGELFVDGRATGATMRGKRLEAAIRTTAGLLVFATHDVPFEETLSIVLVDDGGRVVDEADIGAWATPGVFTDLELDPPELVSFRFNDEGRWSVRVLPRPVMSLPWWPDVRGVSRAARLQRAFKVRWMPRKQARGVARP
jgi:hypothetical protein